MKGLSRFRRLVLLALLVLVLAGALVLAQGGPLQLPRWVVAGGGGTSTDGAGLAVSGSIGQVSVSRSADDIFSLQGGFWAAPTSGPTTSVYLPLVVRPDR